METQHPSSEIAAVSGTIYSFRRHMKNFSFFVTNPNDTIMNHHVNGKFYEEEELDIIGRSYRGGHMLDIGANVGNHTVYFSKILLGELIIPFEPNPVASRVLRINCALNGCDNLDMTLLDIALGAAESRLKPITPQADNLGHTIFEVEEGAGTLCLPGDTMFADRPVGLIKLDVEGMELEILAGLSQTLRRWRPTIFVEVWDEKRAQFMEWREQSGYLISTNFRRYRNIDNFLLYHKSGQNPLA